jgi:sugar/nucleoside kinase (ribokinase family)
LKVSGASSAADAVARLWTDSRRAVVVTGGERGCWYAGAETAGAVVHRLAFEVEVADTTGCGDVFHGAYAAALARGVALDERIAFASAAAAIKATRRGGQEGIPDRNSVERLVAGVAGWETNLNAGG